MAGDWGRCSFIQVLGEAKSEEVTLRKDEKGQTLGTVYSRYIVLFREERNVPRQE